MSEQISVFLCRGGESQDGNLEFRRLLWAAEAKADRVFQVDRACQAEGGRAMADLARERGMAGLVLAACPRALAAGDLTGALAEVGLSPGAMRLVDAYDPPPEVGGICPVRRGSVEALLQALAVSGHQAPLAVQEWPVSTRVLVLGDGLAALTCVEELARAGRQTLLVTPTRRLAPAIPEVDPQAQAATLDLVRLVKDLPEVEVLLRGRLLSLDGTAGDFTARLRDLQRQTLTRRVGAVIVAQAPPKQPNLPPGLLSSVRLITLSELWSLLSSPEHFRLMVGHQDSPRVGLMVGMHRQAWPTDLRSACLAARQLIDALGARVTIFTGQAKMAAPDLEELTQAVRGEGALFVKFTQGGLSLDHGLSGRSILARYTEEILDRPVEQELDLLAVDETPAPDQAWHELASTLGLAMGADGRMQPDLVAALPVSGGRGGVWVAGPARSGGDWEVWAEEARAAVAEVELLLEAGLPRTQVGRVTVDRKRCTLCLTCLRVCPQGAMGRLERRPFSNPLVCTACGTCAGECPMDAIQVVGADDGRYRQEMEAARAQAGGMLELEPGPELLVMACANSAFQALREARLAGRAWPPGARLVEVPCAGKIDPDYVLRAFNLGLDAVLVLSCHAGACQSLGGNTWADWRMDNLRALMTEAGMEAERLMLARLAPVEPALAMQKVEAALARLREMGPSPLKIGGRVRDFLGRFAVQVDHTFVIL